MHKFITSGLEVVSKSHGVAVLTVSTASLRWVTRSKINLIWIYMYIK